MFGIRGLKISSFTRRAAVATSFFDKLGFHLHAPFCSKESLGASGDECLHGFTLSYLVNSCRMPLETARAVASKVNLKTPKNPDLVLSFLRSQGFSKAQILNLLQRFPQLLCSNSDTILLPKFEFLHSIGLSKSECVQFVYSCPFILKYSLKNRIIPSYNYLKSVLAEEEMAIKFLKRSARVLGHDFKERMAPNIAFLRTFGVSEAWISFLVLNSPDSISCKHAKFCSIVNQVRDMGFDPSKVVFVEAIRVVAGLTSSSWERKFEVYRKCGWSKDQTLFAFKKFPQCLSLSEDKIMKCMDFLVHKMGAKPVDIATIPFVLAYSFEKRIVPRCSVVQSLYSKGLLKKKVSISSIVQPGVKTFLERYVTKFPEHVAWLSCLYAGEIKVFDV